MAASRWVDVIVPVPVRTAFTYAWSLDCEPEPGLRVFVPFGRNRVLLGVVIAVRPDAPDYPAKEVLRCVDEHPSFQRQQLALWYWMAEYYLCAPGEAMAASMPGFMQVEPDDESTYTLRDDGVWSLRFAGPRHDSDAVNRAFASLSRAKLQAEALLRYFQFALEAEPEDNRHPWVAVAALIAEGSDVKAAHLSALVERGILERELRPLDRSLDLGDSLSLPELSPAQQSALAALELKEHTQLPKLLWGATGSGKTEVYLHLAAHAIEEGKHVLLMVPEIGLVPQVVQRAGRALGPDRVVPWHHQLADGERRALWEHLLDPDSAPRIVVATRSGILLPWHRLGLIVVDEEHETSYKQQEPAPRYHARDVAVWLAQQKKIPIVLGSATPSVETWHNAAQGKYQRVDLTERYSGVAFPEVVPVSTLKAQALHQQVGPFTPESYAAVAQTLVDRQQVLVFQNRRGYAPVLTCMNCGWIAPCTDCDVSLTYHKKARQLVCHYCGLHKDLPDTCPQCRQSAWDWRGLGTERIEEEVEALFPEARILRVDSDSTRSKRAMTDFLHWMESGEIDLVVGTQMVGKGLDLAGLSLAIVTNADLMLNRPDFRAHERAFQLLLQVAGRTGRRELRGRLLIQTATPGHPVLQRVVDHDVPGMMDYLIRDRAEHHYPPFARMVRIEVRHRKESVARDVAHFLATQLLKALSGGILGPDAPPVARIQAMYRQHLWIKLPADGSVKATKRRLLKEIDGLIYHPHGRSVRVIVDVDPN
ncbi:MAG: primosomal protein N' [Bacteroidetes bacterium]|nr:primosomal protein N' [Bacteroidota bacterium]